MRQLKLRLLAEAAATTLAVSGAVEPDCCHGNAADDDDDDDAAADEDDADDDDVEFGVRADRQWEDKGRRLLLNWAWSPTWITL